MQHTITDLLDLAVTSESALSAEQASAEFTQAERAFVTQFLADTLAHLVRINADNCTDPAEEYFMRLQDAQEVIENLHMLYSKADTDSAVFNFTLADAAVALCSYDTEYRESIQEQFAYACVEHAYKRIPARSTFLHLPARIFAAY